MPSSRSSSSRDSSSKSQTQSMKSKKGSESPPLSIMTESSRASQLSSFSKYSFNQLERLLFYRPPEKDEAESEESGTTNLLNDPVAPVPKGRILGISQALGLQRSSVAEGPGNDTESLNENIPLTPRGEIVDHRDDSLLTPQPSSSFTDNSSHSAHSDVTTHLTTPTVQGHSLEDRTEKESEPVLAAEEYASGSLHAIPSPTGFPTIKLSPPPPRKRKSFSISTLPVPSVPFIANAQSKRARHRPRPLSLPTSRRESMTQILRMRLSAGVYHELRPPSGVQSEMAPSPLPPDSCDDVLSPLPDLSFQRTFFVFGFLIPWCWLVAAWVYPSIFKERAPSSFLTPTTPQVPEPSTDFLLPLHHSPLDNAYRFAHSISSATRTRHGRLRRNPRRSRTRDWGRCCGIAGTGAICIGALFSVALWGAATS